jgi:hypothetical protein
VVRRRSRKFDPKDTIEIAGKFGYELRSTVRYDAKRRTMMLPYLSKKETSGSFRVDGRVGGYEVRALAEAVDDDHDCVVAMCERQFHYEVHADGVPTFRRCFEGV